jgi:long-subunit fatty acid transport protein
MLLLLASIAHAGGIASPAVIGGPESGPATANPAATFYNPAALGASHGVDVMLDAQSAFIGITATTTRNEGIDPNTGEAYGVAKGAAIVPVALLGGSFEVVPDRLVVGLAVDQPFTGGGDYRKGETNPPPYTSWTRYAGINVSIITLQTQLAVAGTPIDGVHIGAGGGYVIDSISVLQGSDPLGTEGKPLGDGEPYSLDSTLGAKAHGGHVAWNAGLFVDRFDKLQVAASYASGATFQAKGTADVTLPELLQTDAYTGPIPADVTFAMPLPAVGRVWLASQISDQVKVGVGYEYYYWHSCCGTGDGDLLIGVKDQNPDDADDAIGPDEGSASSLGTELHIPRRLWNARNLAATVEFEPGEKLWFGGRVGYDEYAVPEYAVSATNLDFPTIGLMGAARYEIGKVTVGVAYSKFILLPRVVEHSAWDVRDTDSPDYVDDRFSAQAPYGASANGTYKGRADVIGIRVSAHFGKEEEEGLD